MDIGIGIYGEWLAGTGASTEKSQKWIKSKKKILGTFLFFSRSHYSCVCVSIMYRSFVVELSHVVV